MTSRGRKVSRERWKPHSWCAPPIAAEREAKRCEGNVVPTAFGGGRARLAQRAGNVALNELDFSGKNDVDAKAQRLRAEPDAPYRKTDVDPIEIFLSRNDSKHCPRNTPKFRFKISGSRNFQRDHFLVSRFETKLTRSAPSLFRVFCVMSGLNSESTRLRNLSEPLKTAQNLIFTQLSPNLSLIVLLDCIMGGVKSPVQRG